MKLFYPLLLLVCCFGFVPTSVNAQVYGAGGDELGVIYSRFFTGNGSIHTNGRIGFSAHIGYVETFYKNRYWSVEINELRNVRELRQSYDFQGPFTSSRSFIYGKINNFYTLHGGFGKQNFFGEPSQTRGVAVGYNYSFGPVLGLLKPYYLDVRRPVDQTTSDIVRIKYSEETAAQFLNINSIYGASGFRVGLNEISVVPGARGKAGLVFDFSHSEEFIRAIEAGVMLDLYMRRIPIMVTQPDNFYFLNLYVSLQLGKRW